MALKVSYLQRACTLWCEMVSYTVSCLLNKLQYIIVLFVHCFLVPRIV